MRARCASLWVAALVTLPGCGKKLQLTECQALLGRYTELLVREENPGVTAEQVDGRVREAHRAAVDLEVFEFERCPDEVKRRQFDCAMEAPNVDGIERCLIL